MKHSNAFISYFGYRYLFWQSIFEHDNEKSDYYMKEMDDNIHKMNTDELLELLNYMFIMDSIFSNRQ